MCAKFTLPNGRRNFPTSVAASLLESGRQQEGELVSDQTGEDMQIPRSETLVSVRLIGGFSRR